ncbi:hypothetical protein GOP47_0029056, partial [Adiantum capillus-veneris]
ASPRTVEVRRVIFEEDGHRYDGPMAARGQPIDPQVGDQPLLGDHVDVGQPDQPLLGDHVDVGQPDAPPA